MKPLAFFAAACTLLGAGFILGRGTAPNTVSETRATPVFSLQLAQNTAPKPAPQAPNDPRELIPLNPNGQQGQGQGQQPQPGQGQAPQDCPVQIYQDGQLYTFPRPGQQPGQGNGQGQQPGQGGGQELFPLNPNAPTTPNSPGVPSSPRLPTPTNPSTPTPRS